MPATVDVLAALSRRELLAGGLVLTAAGCAAERAAPTPPVERTVATDLGPVRVPAAPARIVCADFYGAFLVVDLGFRPVGVSGSGYAGSGAPYADKLAKVPSVGDYVEPNPEKVAAAGPDLILRTIDTERPMYDKLTAIAPTVVISFEGLSLKDVTTKLGAALGRPAQARDLLRTYDTKAAAIRSRHAAALAKLRFAFASPTGSGAWWLYGPSWTDLTVLGAAGARFVPAAAAQKAQTREYSMERLDVLADADVLLVTSGPDGKIAPENAELTRTAMWKRLPAVRAGRVYPIPYGTSSPGTAFALLDAFGRLLGELA